MNPKNIRWQSVLKSKRDKKKITNSDGSIVDAMQRLEDKVLKIKKKKNEKTI